LFYPSGCAAAEPLVLRGENSDTCVAPPATGWLWWGCFL